jgi:hypothetical protein
MTDPFSSHRSFKVVVSFHAIGSAPRLKVSKFTVDGTLRMAELTNYLAKIIKESDVHLYVSSSIELMDDQYIGDFVKIFGKMSSDETQGSINIHYSVGRAYL